MRPVYSACQTWASKLLLVSLQCDGCPTLLLSAPLLTCAVPSVRWSSGRLWPLAATEGAGQSLQVHWCFLILSNMGSPTSLLRTPPLQVGEFPGRTEILTPKDLGHCQGDDTQWSGGRGARPAQPGSPDYILQSATAPEPPQPTAF